MIERICKECGTCFQQYNTTQTRCQRCTYNRYAKPAKPIKRMGKKAKQWIEDRHEWIKAHPPAHNGKWECYLKNTPLCPRYLDIDQLTLDHVIPKSAGGTNEFDNLKPACVYCNGQKGSKKG